MGYYIRVLAVNSALPTDEELRSCLPGTSSAELVVESAGDDGWSQLVLRHRDGPEIALIERNVVAADELGSAEIAEFIEEVKGEKPESTARWLEQFLPRVKVIYAFQLLGGTEVDDGWAAVHAVQSRMWARCGGILQADGEGFTNEDGYHILWQFSDTASGPWNMAIIDQQGRWTRFEMDLGNEEHRAAFVRGMVPAGVKLRTVQV